MPKISKDRRFRDRPHNLADFEGELYIPVLELKVVLLITMISKTMLFYFILLDF